MPTVTVVHVETSTDPSTGQESVFVQYSDGTTATGVYSPGDPNIPEVGEVVETDPAPAPDPVPAPEPEPEPEPDPGNEGGGDDGGDHDGDGGDGGGGD